MADRGHAPRLATHVALRRRDPRRDPPYLIATKLSAFAGRGRGDHLGSRDLEDIILLVDGREKLGSEVAAATADVRGFVAAVITDLLDQPRFVDAIFGFLRADVASQAPAESVVLPRLEALRSLSGA